jgi:ferritin
MLAFKVYMKMPEYDLGTLNVKGHDSEKITQALEIPDERFDDLVDLARHAWEHEDTISESIEYLAQNAKGSELVLALVFLGRIWEDNREEETE